MNFEDFLALFHKQSSEEAAPVPTCAPLESVEAKPLRVCDLNPAHPPYAAAWLPGNRDRAGRWAACPLCAKEWNEISAWDQRLLRLLPGEPLWSRPRR